MGGLGTASSPSSAPVTRPTAEKLPPQVPLTHDGGAAGGCAVGRPAHGLPPPRVGAASRPMCQLAWRSGCSEVDPKTHEQRRPCGRRDTERSEWRVGRAGGRQNLSGEAAAGSSLPWPSVARQRAPRTAAVAMPAGTAGLTELREGCQPVRVETAALAGGLTRSATARPCVAGTRP